MITMYGLKFIGEILPETRNRGRWPDIFTFQDYFYKLFRVTRGVGNSLGAL